MQAFDEVKRLQPQLSVISSAPEGVKRVIRFPAIQVLSQTFRSIWVPEDHLAGQQMRQQLLSKLLIRRQVFQFWRHYQKPHWEGRWRKNAPLMYFSDITPKATTESQALPFDYFPVDLQRL
ncbi:hypothetical protein C8263_15275 [Deinococcus arcticus]|uniref:Uncharacterized protein n=1 Tax=Deinococcus arcticus TaxID=2136176 RepID=A0A2T3W4X6_9DEIO|nr:hypothetical protein C8263_15275 [Deinococcus arcticus]